MNNLVQGYICEPWFRHLHGSRDRFGYWRFPLGRILAGKWFDPIVWLGIYPSSWKGHWCGDWSFFIIICLLSSLIQFHIVLGLYFLFTRKQAAFSVVNPDKIFGQSRVLVKIWLSRFRGFIYDTPRGRVWSIVSLELSPKSRISSPSPSANAAFRTSQISTRNGFLFRSKICAEECENFCIFSLLRF